MMDVQSGAVERDTLRVIGQLRFLCNFGRKRSKAGVWDFEGRAGNSQGDGKQTRDKEILAGPPRNGETQRGAEPNGFAGFPCRPQSVTT